MMTVHAVAQLAGVSERTLRYYDRLGLLPPAAASEAGYRLYDEADLKRLQRILFLRELEFPLKDIAAMLTAEEKDNRLAVERHRELLRIKVRRLQGLIDLCGRLLKGEDEMNLHGFDNRELEEKRDAYAQEARERWGQTEAYKESERRAAGYGAKDWETIRKEMDEVFGGFAALVGQDPTSPAVRAQVERWRAVLASRFYACDDAMLANLGAMYLADERFTKTLDAYGEGTAKLMSEAMRRLRE